MKDSYQEAVIPLADDPRIQEKYLNFYNTVRIGKILEDLDTFAGEFQVSSILMISFPKGHVIFLRFLRVGAHLRIMRSCSNQFTNYCVFLLKQFPRLICTTESHRVNPHLWLLLQPWSIE